MDSLLEEIRKLRQENEQMRADMNTLMGSLSSIKAELEDSKVEYHKQVHESIGKYCQSSLDRIEALEEISTLSEQPGPKRSNQIEIFRSLLASRNGQWASVKELRHKMNLSKVQFSQLLRMSEDFVVIRRNPQNRREKLVKINC